ncbi:MAG: MATE family efflux transporter [Firmicutes bacterium]|nr:MATE family efflux transporter [Bacillota bacterium]
MRIQLSEHFTWNKLLRFTFPSIIMMIFTSIYVVVDGFFVSNFAGKTAFSAINLVYPALALVDALAFMMESGSAAIVGKQLGEGNRKQANNSFSLIVCIVIVFAILIMIPGYIFLDDISRLLGASEEMMPYCRIYARILLSVFPFRMCQYIFQAFFIAGEKSSLGLKVTLGAGGINMILDALFVAVFKWGLAGACIATVLAQVFGSLCGIVYFIRPNDSLLQLVKPKFDLHVLVKSCTNGMSEFVGNLAYSTIFILYNWQLMRMIGQNGVAAYGVIQYIVYIFASIYYGFNAGVSSLVSFNFGAKNHEELHNLYTKSLVFMTAAGLGILLINLLLADSLSRIFVGYDEQLYLLTSRALKIYSYSFTIYGINIFGSAFFTALNNGWISGILAFTRLFLFEVGCVFLLPYMMGVDGIWYAKLVAELLGIGLTTLFFIRFKKKYHY